MKCIRDVSFLLVFVSIVAAVVRDKRRPHWVYDDTGCRTPDLGAGSCVSVSDCYFISELIKQTSSSDSAKDILRNYACANSKVCCPTKSSNFEKPLNKDDHSHHKNLKLLPTQSCGDVRAWGLFIGNVTNVFEFGWPALLKYQKYGDPFLCGGSLISKRYVLTAAHCIKNEYPVIGVRLGEYDVETNPDCTEQYKKGNTIKVCAPPHQDFDVDNIVVHPEYDSKTFNNDIGLIRLRGQADTSQGKVTPICLPITNALKQHNVAKYTAIGWGTRENGPNSPVLLKVLAPKMENYVCNREYNINLSDKHICAGGVTKYDSCAGDGGGPLMGYYSIGDKLITILYGIVSMRSPYCEEKLFPAVYTKVAPYVEWILDNIQP